MINSLIEMCGVQLNRECCWMSQVRQGLLKLLWRETNEPKEDPFSQYFQFMLTGFYCPPSRRMFIQLNITKAFYHQRMNMASAFVKKSGKG
jgi:hypothetical protein